MLPTRWTRGAKWRTTLTTEPNALPYGADPENWGAVYFRSANHLSLDDHPDDFTYGMLIGIFAACRSNPTWAERWADLLAATLPRDLIVGEFEYQCANLVDDMPAPTELEIADFKAGKPDALRDLERRVKEGLAAAARRRDRDMPSGIEQERPS